MNIYFCGSHSTGKTTLAEHVAKHYKYNYVAEYARSYIRTHALDIDNIRKDYEKLKDFQALLLSTQIENEQEHFNTTHNTVFDRSFWDILSYFSMHVGPIQKTLSNLDGHITQWKNQRNIVFLITPNHSLLENDGERETTTFSDMIRVDQTIKTLFSVYNVPYIEISSTNFSERKQLVETVISVTK